MRLHHVVVRGVGDGAAVGDGDEPGAAARPQHPVHPVPVDVGAAPSPGRSHPLAQHVQDLLEIAPREIPEGVRSLHQIPEVLLGDARRRLRLGQERQGLARLGGRREARHRGRHLLGEHVERLPHQADAVQIAPAHRVNRGGALEQVVPGQRVEDALGDRAQPVPRAPHPLQQGGDGAGRADVAHQFHVADVDAQLQRRGGHHHRHLRGLELLLGFEPGLAGEAAVVGQHLALAEPVGELVRHPFHQPPGVHEHQRGAVALDLLHDAVVDLGPQPVGGDGPQLLVRHVDGQVHFPLVAHVHDGAFRRAVAPEPAGAHQQAGDVLHGLLGGAEADALQRPAGQGVQALQREREVGAALVSGHRVDLVHDDRVRALQHLPAALGGEQDVERLGRGDEDVRRLGDHALPLRGRGVAGAHGRADVVQREPLAPAGPRDLRKRLLQVLLDVVAQGLERRDVDHVGVVLGRLRGGDEPVDGPEKGRQGLAGTRGGGDERVPSPGDLLPAGRLRRRRLAEAVPEPVAHQRVKSIDHCGRV